MASSLGQRGQVSAQNLVPSKYLLRGVDQAEQVLGRGAYGVVFSGDWRGTPVAIKRHHPMLVLDEHEQFSTFYRQFLQEFPMLKELPHPNIVQVFGMVAATGPHDTPGLVMECLSQTLRKRCSVQPALSLLEKCSIALGISSALEYLHSRSIIHRDLTTNNIMLCEVVEAGDVQLKAKITDVGGAAELDDSTQAQMMTMNPGAQTYMAPETQRVSNEPGRTQYGTPADCYAFGVCLLAMCVGREPPNIVTLAREGRTRDLQALGSDHLLHDMISRCLKVDPAHRPNATAICAGIGAVTEILRRQQQQPTASSSTAADTQVDASEPSPDQAEKARLRQELQELQEQLRSAEHQLDTAQQAIQDRTAVLAERDQLLHTIQEQLTAAQHAIQDRTALLAERDELLMERDAAAIQLSASAESADAHRARESLMHIASLEGEAGSLARYSLLLGPPPLPTAGTCPKATWKTVGKLPIPKASCYTRSLLNAGYTACEITSLVQHCTASSTAQAVLSTNFQRLFDLL
ncbi:mitogen-activated protein kinase kinase kinase 11-like isoform X2 [Sycon ciliatum]|uniref:mitogen-activated protein kinase kinase kinase 11-like isoform X2 n=1 Tax=Sycon ciliatum TaxID=27933 RepID=UPI0031F6DB49